MLEDLRHEFQELKLNDPKDPNEYESLREKVYAEFRNAIDVDIAYAYLILMLEIEQEIIDKAPHYSFNVKLRSANSKHYFINKFDSKNYIYLEDEIMKWFINFLKHFKLEEVKRENQQWKALNPDRIRHLGQLGNVLAFIHDKQDLVSKLSKSCPELEQWLAFRKELLRQG